MHRIIKNGKNQIGGPRTTSFEAAQIAVAFFMRILMWFRADLRVRDNTALYHAGRAADDGVVAVFAVCPGQWADHDWGGAKVDFVLRNLAALSETLAAKNIPLNLIRCKSFASVPAKLLKIARQCHCEALYFNREYEVNELARDRETTALFEKNGLAVRSFTDQVILDVGEIRTGLGDWYTVFAPFKRKWLATLEEQGPPNVWPAPRKQQPIEVVADEVPSSLKEFKSQVSAELWGAGESAARKRLDAFVGDAIEDYHADRDIPAIDGTSTLSPHLAAGVISPRQCLEAAVVANAGRTVSGKKGPMTWISELIWREFYRHILMGFPRISRHQPFKTKTDALPWRRDEKQFQAWCEGRTGFPIVDAAMRQLSQTGWMHNRLRMIVAMFLTKDLFIDWRWGERFFMQHLIDGDLANNNGGWQWSASTGTDAAPYFRIFNPVSQSKRYDPDGEFIRRYVPELDAVGSSDVHEPQNAALLKGDYPDPMVDRKASRERVLSAFKALR